MSELDASFNVPTSNVATAEQIHETRSAALDEIMNATLSDQDRSMRSSILGGVSSRVSDDMLTYRFSPYVWSIFLEVRHGMRHWDD